MVDNIISTRINIILLNKDLIKYRYMYPKCTGSMDGENGIYVFCLVSYFKLQNRGIFRIN